MAGFSRRGFLQGSIVGTAAVAVARPRPAPAAVEGGGARLVVVQTEVNGQAQALTVGPDEPLVDSLRTRLGLRGTKKACGAGTCGACAVLVDGRSVNACLLPALAVEGRRVTSVEGLLRPGGQLHPVQRAFMAHDAAQCGYCTPGFVVEASAFHDRWRASQGTAEPDRETVAQALAGHLCRCGTYNQILDAVQAACRGEHDAADLVPARHEIRQKVTGQALFTVDVQLPGMLHARVLRSPHAHAILRELDDGPARALEGVKAVHRLVAEGGVVRFAGQEVLAVAAVDEATAEAALRAVKVRWEPQAHVLDFDEALADGAPVVWPAGKGAPSAAEGPVLGPRLKGNLRGPFSSSVFGNPSGARKRLDLARQEGRSRKGRFSTAVQLHSALEPHACVAWWHPPAADLPRGAVPRASLELWASTQAVHWLRREVAQHFRLKEGDVRVRSEHTGGGFGAKATVGPEVLLAVELSRQAGAPVRLVLDRAEELTVGGNRPAQRIETEIAWTSNGQLDALRAEAWGNSGVAVGNITGMVARLLYKSDLKDLVDYDVTTFAPPGKPFRAPGGPPAIFALEQVMDQVGEALGRDPLALRRAWDGHPGRQRLYDWIEGCPDWQARASLPREGRFREGVGLACGSWFMFVSPVAAVAIEADGEGIVVATATQDMGQGSRSVVAQAVAARLGVPASSLTLRMGDSADPGGVMSGGSRTTVSIGPAADEAAARFLEELVERCQRQLGWADAAAAPGGVAHGGAVVPYAQVLAATGPISSLGRRKRDPGGYFLPFGAAGIRIGKELGAAVQLSRVRVDTWTGKVQVLGVHIGLAVGRLHSPVLARSQVHGGVIQGIGYALYEERRLDPQTGQLLSRNLDDYRIPGIGDVPPVDVRFDETPLPGVLGEGIGLGEVCTVPCAASIANAVKDATGWRPDALPIRPDRVLEALS